MTRPANVSISGADINLAAEDDFEMPLLNEDERRKLGNLRARARRRGLCVKSSRRPISRSNRGGLSVIDALTDTVLAGAGFTLTVADAERAVEADIAKVEADARGERDAPFPF